MGVIICIDSKAVADVNDPSDASDWLILEHGLPQELFIKNHQNPVIGISWDDLPLKFYWNGHKYMLSKVENIRKIHEHEQTIFERSAGTGKEMGKFRTVEGESCDNC